MRWISTRVPCYGQGNLFFPEDNEDKERREVREARAKALCWTCEVREQCLSWAMRNPLKADTGIWGAHNHLERAALRRKRVWNPAQLPLVAV